MSSTPRNNVSKPQISCKQCGWYTKDTETNKGFCSLNVADLPNTDYDIARLCPYHDGGAYGGANNDMQA